MPTKITNKSAFVLSIPGLGVTLARGKSATVEDEKAAGILSTNFFQALVAKGVVEAEGDAVPKAAPEPAPAPSKPKSPTVAEIREMEDADALADLLAGGLSKKRAEVAEARLAELAGGEG